METQSYTQALDPICHEEDPHRVSRELQGFVTEYINEEAPQEPADKPKAAPTRHPEAVSPGASVCKSSVTWGRRICVAVGDDICTEKVLKYAAKYICKPQDTVTLVHVAKGASTEATADSQLLKKAKATLLRCACDKVSPERVSLAGVPAGKHVGQALVAHCLEAQYNILVIGSRGLTGMKTKLMALVGEGSVSRYCTEQLPRSIAVVVVKPTLDHNWGKS